MLSQIHVRDLALIRRLSMDMEGGFSVLTGETGAGKSLVLDSLNLFLTGKGAKDLVRQGEEKLSVSLFFTDVSSEIRERFSEYFTEEDGNDLILTRTVSESGKSSCKIGDRSVPFSVLASLSEALIAICGQHDSGGLLDEKKHGAYLDSALDKDGQEILFQYGKVYEAYREAKNKLDTLLRDAEDDEKNLPLYEFHQKEIAAVAPKEGEEEELEERLRTLQGFEKRHAGLATALRALEGGEKGKGAIFLLDAAARKLEKSGEEDLLLSDRLYDALRVAKDVSEEVAARLSDLGGEDPEEELDRVQKRLSALFRLKQKYKKDIPEIILYYKELREKKSLTLSRKDDIKRQTEEVKKKEAELFSLARKLTQARKETAEALTEGIHTTLAFLDLPKMRFSVEFTPLEQPEKGGAEKIRFVTAANTGEGAKPLSQVASGGELSRIMLALQLKLGKAKDADTLVFDEIDTGISGATAQKIGIALKTLSERKQVLCVTHSAQVSTLSDQHYLVKKSEWDGRTETDVTLLSPEESLRESARLLGGREISGNAEKAAESLTLEGETEWKKWRTQFS